MLAFSRIDAELSVYQGKKVIIWGCGSAGKRVCHMLAANGIEVTYFCDSNKKKWGTCIVGEKKCISPETLATLPKKEIIVQIGSSYEMEICRKLQSIGIEDYIFFSEFMERLSDLYKYKMWGKSPETLDYYIEHIFDNNNIYSVLNGIWEYFLGLNAQSEDCIILSMPPKTGDHTIQATLEKEGIIYVNFWHGSSYYTDKLQKLMEEKKIKIITAVRDPISQNLSCFFQRHHHYWHCKEYWEDGGNIQKLFDMYMEEEIGFSKMLKKAHDLNARYDYRYPYRLAKSYNRYTSLVQYFHEIEFKKGFGIDLYQYPYDCEKGLSVIKKGDMEIYIFQLEKLNCIYKDFFASLGIKTDTLCTEYQSKDKWYCSAYKKAKNQIALDETYIDACYNSQYMKHFYCDRDIDKFKSKWMSNIQN